MILAWALFLWYSHKKKQFCISEAEIAEADLDLAQVFSCEFCEISKNIFFTEQF